MSLSKETWVALLVVIALALVAELLVLPFSTTDSGDIGMRTWMGWQWLSDPHFIISGPLGPLHFYLIGASLAVVNDPLYGPMVLHIGFALAAPCFIYLFTREVFASSRAALLVAATYALYPVAIRASVTVRSETIFVVFLLVSMWLLAIARSDRGRLIHAGGSGLALTLAAMLRFEGWMLIPLLGLLLWRKPRFMILFGAIAMIHPVIWMSGNWIEFGNPLYSTDWTSDFERHAMGKSDLPFTALARNAVVFSLRTLRGMNLLIAMIAVAGAVIALVKRDQARVWLVPLVGVSALMTVGILRGSLAPKLPYTLTLGTMLLPFSALVFRQLGVERWGAGRFLRSTLALVGTLTVLSALVSWQALRSGPFAGLTLIPRVLTDSPVPRFPNQAIASSVEKVVSRALEGEHDGLISDFYGWSATSYVALRTRWHPDDIFMAKGTPNVETDMEALSAFIDEHPQGVIVLLTGSRFANRLETETADRLRIEGKELGLQQLQAVEWPAKQDSDGPWLQISRYQVLLP